MLKQSLFAVAVCIAVPFAALADDDDNGLCDITVKVTGLKNDRGVVRMALFNSADAFKKSKGSEDDAAGALEKATAPIKSRTASHIFQGIPYYEYAIKVFHDEDNSGKFVTGLFGIPKVEYGFSNNALGKMGPPAYEKAKFTVNTPEMTVDITAHSGM